MKKTILYASLLLLAAYAGGTMKLFSRTLPSACLDQSTKVRATETQPAAKKAFPAGAIYPGIKPLGCLTTETF